ncbi:MAG: hypothetical protein IJA59_06960 [Clostridia bacterium]|nr:hypothetical protein [Clostridia bacterium]
MKKSSFVAMVLGTISLVFFALGMCMALLPEWDAFTEGVIFGAIGLVLGLVTLLIWRKMEHKAPLHVHLSGKTALVIITGVMGTLLLGIGMCFCLVWNNIIIGTMVGLMGILLLMALIPLVKGIK